MKFSATVEAAENFTGSFQILRLSQKLAMLRKLRQKTTSKLAFKHVHSVKDVTTIMELSNLWLFPGLAFTEAERNPTNVLFSLFIHYLFVASVIFVVFLAPQDPDGPTHDQRGRNGFTTSGKSLLYPFKFLSIPTSYKQELIICISLLCMFLDMYLGTWSPIWFREDTFVHYDIFCFDMI